MVLNVGRTLFVGATRLANRNKALTFVETAGSRVALKCPEVQPSREELLGMSEEFGACSLTKMVWIDVQLLYPAIP